MFKAVVATTSGAIDSDARTLLVELHAANPGGVLQPGTYTEVHFDLPQDPNVLRIPTTALVFRESGLQVAVVGRDNRAELKQITLGRNLGDDVQVFSGLSASDRVINDPPDSLVNGELVAIANPLDGTTGQLARAAGPSAVGRPGTPSRPAGP
jgi:multidrug efflux pump subunit AcrA (membrane-fusion protein)